MKNNNIYNCKIERSKINGNYTIWLPEQSENDFVDSLVDNYDFSQGKLWEILLKTCANENNLDVSSVYFEPEGDVFVSYTSSYELGEKMKEILDELISNPEYLAYIVNISGFKN